MSKPKTLFEKVWDAHTVVHPEGEPAALYIDLHLVHEVTSPQAFEGLRTAKRKVRRPDLTVATIDHNVPTIASDRLRIQDPISAKQIETLRNNCKEFGIQLFDIGSAEHGIVHVIGPHIGLTQPGMTLFCRGSPTSHPRPFCAPALGAVASEGEHLVRAQ